MRLIRAALAHGVAPVDLLATHLAAGVHVLQIRLRGQPVVVLSAELAGETATGSFALRLMPLDPSHVPELTAIADGSADEAVPVSGGPMSATASAIFDSEPPLAPPEVDEEDLEASVLFDPEAALISRAPPRPAGTTAEDTLTIPVRASMMPPGMGEVPPSARTAPAPPPPSGPHTISHLSFPSSVPLTEREEARPEPPDPSQVSQSSEAHASTQRQGSMTDASISITVDFDTSQGSVHTERLRPEWSNEDGGAAADPSLAGSVVFDPDVLAREQRHDAAPPEGADGEGYSVVFGTEATSPGLVAGQMPSRAVGVVVSSNEDLSLTPTMPMDVPPRRPPSIRRQPSVRREPVDLEETVNEEAETFPRSSGRRPLASSGAMSGEAGPRTMRRNTGEHGIVIVGRVIANRYRIESLVGAGAIGAVYKASHVDLPRTFAIKVLHPHFRADPQLLASFRTEARAASLLDHPNVTVVHDFGEEPDGLVYIVMEYLPGVNLQAVLDEERRIDPRRAIAIMVQVCGALAAAHERGIVHRDVKPDNIMLVPSRDDEGRPFEMVKVCDFGIAALETTPGGPSGPWTAGTPEYMAPEQAQGRSDARTDVYACGIVLYEMLIGRPPFVGSTPAATLAKHATEMPRRPTEIMPGFPPALEAVILCAIEKAPERRFASMRDLRTQLRRLL